MNQAMIAGHLGVDPEVRFTSSGQKVTTFRVGARSRREDTIWWRVTVWGEQFDKMIAYLKKGSPVVVFGEISKPEIFTDKEGKPQVSMSITASNVLFSPFGRSDSSHQGGAHQQAASLPTDMESAYVTADASLGQSGESFSDDELPF